MAGQHDDLGGDAGGLHLPEDVHAAEFRHDHVEQDHVERAAEGGVEPRHRVFVALHFVSRGRKHPLAGGAEGRVVVDDQYPLHGPPIST